MCVCNVHNPSPWGVHAHAKGMHNDDKQCKANYIKQ